MEDRLTIERFLSSAYGSAYGDGHGDGFGYGFGDGDGHGSGHGYGYGDGDGLKSYNGQKVCYIDNVPTLIFGIHGDLAQGAIIRDDLTLMECYVSKYEEYFAHGRTAHEAFEAAKSKAFAEMSEEDRIAAFRNEFPDFDTPAPNAKLFEWHNRLTGSCRLGREEFAKAHGIDVENGYMSVNAFIDLTKDAYGGEIISKLRE